MNLSTGSKLLLRQKVNLSNYCTMQVGGAADYFAEPTSEEELREALKFAKKSGIPHFVLGKGSNVLFADEGYPGLVISMMHFDDSKIAFDVENDIAKVSSGIYLYRFAIACREHGLSGMEFLASIPGTVGGALIMNAGYSRHPGQRNEIGDIVKEVTVLDEEGCKRILDRDHLEFSYRKSNLTKWIVLEATFHLWKRRRDEIEKEIRANFEYRNSQQDLTRPSLGSIFKNPPPPHESAGRLIEKLGLKGTRVGGAMVSEKHGNFFVNLGDARASDIIQLMRSVQKAVFDATKLRLEPEIRIVERP